jgi:hypothetical protein
MMNVAGASPMKVVVRSSSLLFTLLSIILHVPIQRKRGGVTETPRVPPQKEVLAVPGSHRDKVYRLP